MPLYHDDAAGCVDNAGIGSRFQTCDADGVAAVSYELQIRVGYDAVDVRTVLVKKNFHDVVQWQFKILIAVGGEYHVSVVERDFPHVVQRNACLSAGGGLHDNILRE